MQNRHSKCPSGVLAGDQGDRQWVSKECSDVGCGELVLVCPTACFLREFTTPRMPQMCRLQSRRHFASTEVHSVWASIRKHFNCWKTTSALWEAVAVCFLLLFTAVGKGNPSIEQGLCCASQKRWRSCNYKDINQAVYAHSPHIGQLCVRLTVFKAYS